MENQRVSVPLQAAILGSVARSLVSDEPELSAARRWVGSLRLGLGHASYVGPAGETAEHAHHAVQVCVALDGSVEVRSAARSIRSAALVIGSDVIHSLRAPGTNVALVYLEPETTDGRRILATADDVAPLETKLAHALRVIARKIDSSTGMRTKRMGHDELAAAFTPATFRSARVDRRVARALALVNTDPARYSTVSSLAAGVGLSPSRFRDLFAGESTISCRRYLVWARLRRAMAAVAAGDSLTVAAHRAGFADSAHFARAFRSMFGLVPSALSRGVRFLAN